MEKKEYYTMILRDEEGYVGEAVYAGPETLKVVTEPGGADRLVRMIRKFADFIETTEAERTCEKKEGGGDGNCER